MDNTELDEAEAFIEELAGPPPTEDEPQEQSADDDSDAEPDEPAAEESAEEQEEASEGPSLDERIAEMEKRQRDTRASFDQEREMRKRLEQELEQLRSAPPTSKGDESADLLSEYEEAFEEDPKAAIAALSKRLKEEYSSDIKSLRAEIEAERQQAYVRELERQEAVMRKAHDDYDAVVTEYLAPKMESNPELAAKWRDGGGTAEAAYELGKHLKSFEEYQSDPSGFEERLKEKLLAELKESGSAPKVGDTLAADNSQGVKSKAKHVTLATEDILDEILG
jgi:hypothetical protein